MVNIYKVLTVFFAITLLVLLGSAYFVSAYASVDPWQIGRGVDLVKRWNGCKLHAKCRRKPFAILVKAPEDANILRTLTGNVLAESAGCKLR